jgi:transcriptional regulator with XRE-family HTH domain
MTSEVMAPEQSSAYCPRHVTCHTAVWVVAEEWRQRRRVSQLDLACQGEVSTRHLSFLETGRAQPSRGMVLHLAEQLEVPLRDRNTLLTAAGFAPICRERPLGDPGLRPALQAVEAIIQGHMPYPALAVDRHWTLVSSNEALPPLLAGVDAMLLQPPVNVMRVALHPSGLAPRTINLVEWRGHLLERLRRQAEASVDPVLLSLLEELRGYPRRVGLGRRSRRRTTAAWSCRSNWRPRLGRDDVRQYDDGFWHAG